MTNTEEMQFVVQISNCWILSQRERQVQREEAQELTDKLDQDWKNIQALMVKKTPKAEQVNKQEEKPKVRMHQSASKMLLIIHFVLSLISDGA